jgi:DNA-binding transcriptional ArsR family regulator
MDSVFRALGDPARIALVEELGARNDQTLFELCVRLIERGHSMSRQAIAKHLAVLRDAGIVRQTVSGRTTIHHLDTAELQAARAWVTDITGRST